MNEDVQSLEDGAGYSWGYCRGMEWYSIMRSVNVCVHLGIGNYLLIFELVLSHECVYGVRSGRNPLF